MNIIFIRRLVFCFLFVSALNLVAQKSPALQKQGEKQPATFTISKTDFEFLLKQEEGSSLSVKNPYLRNGKVIMKSRNGDITFIRVQLDYFPAAELLVQVNGEYSTQVFIMTRDKSLFYKGTVEKERVLMTKCSEDEIVSE